MAAVGICNAALSYLGIDRRLQVFPENTTSEGVACATHYDAARKELLRMHSWAFATKTVPLELIEGAVHPLYAYAYAKPADSIKLILLHEQQVDQPVEYELELSGTTPAILSNYADLHVKYVADVEDGFDPLFESALSLHLATKMGLAVGRTDEEVERIRAELYRTLPYAESADSGEGWKDENRDADWIKARTGRSYGYGGYGGYGGRDVGTPILPSRV